MDEDVVDVSEWSVIDDEPEGQDPDKLWIAPTPTAERHEQWLWKPRRTTAGGKDAQINDVAEVVTSRIAAQLGIPAAECRYAGRAGVLGLISRNVAPEGFDLNVGATYLVGAPGYSRQEPVADEQGRRRGLLRRDSGYTLDAVEYVLRGLDGPPASAGLSALQVFSGYLLLDALTANTDRHPGNWALLTSPEGKRCLAPTFDHGSALGSGLTDTNRSRQDVASWCAKGLAKSFEPKGQTLLQLANEAMERWDGEVWRERLGSLPPIGDLGILEAPPNRLSVVASTFMAGIVEVNRRRLRHVDDGQD
ncbi:MAG: HipA domain-containing protein [Intrasporangium sp.]|uniref:HipA domain-containing protein n=1 Tax=Intrasporangium sp. TaxID=1925024 RepID=UPI002649E18F|nr:HipA domain-containing protein [Intrasporangium sp.]MDN5796946.1 HipA domain-containing protein [Intrasporangium sp.]